ncbi:MAG TPA: J domain-containing protein [Burkholderiaceae bacterium]|nr:J domain-containing protein [Burkholderiaceae bacterium]
MPKVHSHYENLKVARDAAPDEIRSAYRALTRQHHPDRHPDDAEAQRIMAVVNVAYAVLSDAAKRREHDLWIRQAEGPAARPLLSKHTLHEPFNGPAEVTTEPAAFAAQSTSVRWAHRANRFKAHVRRHPWRYGATGVFATACFGVAIQALLQPGIAEQIATVPALAKPAGYLRPPTAPNGQAWPAQSGYVAGYEELNTGGLSDVTIDNTANDADMFVRMVSLDGPSAVAVRTVYVAAHSHFKIGSLSVGTYDLRYRNLATGGLLRSPAFILEEVGGTRHSATSLKLNGTGAPNMQAYALSDSDFF